MEEESEGLDTSYIVLIVVFSVAFITPIAFWCVREIKKIEWERLFATEQGQRLIEAKDAMKNQVNKARKKTPEAKREKSPSRKRKAKKSESK